MVLGQTHHSLTAWKHRERSVRTGGPAGGARMRTFSIQERRRLLVRRHHLRGDAKEPDEVTAALIGLHATDPASVYLSVLARSAETTLADVSAAMYDRKSLVRWMAMRRTLFVFPTADVPLIQAAVSTPLASVLRRQLQPDPSKRHRPDDRWGCRRVAYRRRMPGGAVAGCRGCGDRCSARQRGTRATH